MEMLSIIITLFTTILEILMTYPVLKQIQTGGYRVFSLFEKPAYFNRKFMPFTVIALLFAAVYPLGTVFSFSKEYEITFYSFYLIVLSVAVCARLTEKSKNPLVFTKRATRLYVVISIFTIIFNVAAAALLPFVYYVGICAVSPFVVVIISFFANLLLCPFEILNNKKYVRRAAEKIQTHGCLTKIGITGSFGKTSVKNILKCMLDKKYDVVMTDGNYNTPLGIALSAGKIDAYTNVFIAEMGARKTGDIKELVDMVKPEYGILTGITGQHLETFKTIENIISEKLVLLESLPDFGAGIVNRRTVPENIVLPGNVCFVGGEEDFVFAENIVTGAFGSRFTLSADGKKYDAETRLLGEHNIQNIVTAAGMALKLGIRPEDIVRAIKCLKSIPHRLELINNGKINVIDDTYNSNPVGAAEALKVLSSFEGKKIAVTPGMVELGKNEREENFALGRKMAAVCDIVLLIGGSRTEDLKAGLLGGGFPEENILHFESLTAAERFFPDLFSAGDTVLFLNDLPDEYN